MKEILFLVIVIVIAMAFIGHRDNAFMENCRAHGGTPVIGTYNKTCYAPGVAIDVN